MTRPLLGPSHPTHSSNHNSRNVPRPSRASHTTWSKYPTLRCYHQRLEHRPNLHNRCTILRSLQKNKSTRALGRVHDGRYWPDTCCTNASHSKASHGSLINRGENAHMPAAAAPVAKVIWDGLRHELPTPTGQNKGRSTPARRKRQMDTWHDFNWKRDGPWIRLPRCTGGPMAARTICRYHPSTAWFFCHHTSLLFLAARAHHQESPFKQDLAQFATSPHPRACKLRDAYHWCEDAAEVGLVRPRDCPLHWQEAP